MRIKKIRVSGFKSFCHPVNLRVKQNGITIMVDFFDYVSPFGILGRLADNLFLEKYMRNLLSERNRVVKEFAESEKWKLVLEK